MARYLSLAQIEKSLRAIESVHPFFGITFLVCKLAQLPIGRAIEFALDSATKAFLDKHYKPDKDSDWYFRVFRISDKRKSWIANDYPSSGLQSVNTRTFGDAFIHPKNSEIWGWKSDYVLILQSHLYKGKRISAFDLAVWLFRERSWADSTDAESVLRQFFDEFSITNKERHALFDERLNDLPMGQMFQDGMISWEQMRNVIGAPPDAGAEERVSTHFEVIISGIRSFTGKHGVSLKPLTLLVGENSSGKTSFMATLSAVCNPAFPIWPALNEPPYSLGSFDAIASFVNGKERQRVFSMGYIVQGKAREDSARIVATYGNDNGQVQLEHVEVNSSAGHFRMTLETGGERYIAQVFSRSKTKKLLEGYVKRGNDLKTSDLTSFVLSNWHDVTASRAENRRRRTEFVELLVSICSFLNPPRTLSIAPIRTRPRRTYDETSDKFSPEGTHIPYVLARILADDLTTKQKRVLVTSLERYGQESGLFDQIQVKQLGENISAPFQILVNPSGVPTNLLDVGYGVSQALPIIVQSVLLDVSELLLLQQPEVHLHPRAQAALGSFFSRLVAEGERQFVIETHSDFIVDRIRQEIAVGNLRPDQVQILFFEKPKIRTTVHVLDLDGNGNITNAPPAYRQFFLREELNLISRTGGED